MRLAGLKKEEEEEEEEDVCTLGDAPDSKMSLMDERLGWSGGSSVRRFSRDNLSRSSF